MARPLVGDRVKETTQTSGTGPVSLAGAASGFRSFAEEFNSGTKCYYLIVDDPTNTVQYEVGIGTFTSGTPNTLSRDTILESTNSNAAVSWDSSTKTVISIANKLLLNSLADALDSDLITAGTSTAYTLATYRPTAGLYEGRFVCCKLHLTNGVAPTLNVDATGAKAIVDINGAAPSLGALVASYYWFKYDATAAKWVVFSPFGYLSAANLQDQTGNYAAASGTNTLTATFSPALTTHLAGRPLRVLIANTNTGAVTFNPNGIGAKNVVNQSGVALEARDLAAGGEYEFYYDGTNYQVRILPTTLTKGYVGTGVIDGTKSSGTYMPTPIGGNFRICVNGGAFTLAAPTQAGAFTMIVQMTNNATAGAVTASGFTTSDLTALDTTNAHNFFLHIVKLNDFTTVRAEALQ